MKDIINHLRCPISGNKVSALSPIELEKANVAIANNDLLSYDGGSKINIVLTEALIDDSKKFIYPVIDGIFFMLKDHAIIDKKRLPSIEADLDPAEKIKKGNRSFYDIRGWEDVDGDFEDAVLFEDLREFSAPYRNKCHSRFGKLVCNGGKYIIDVASGPIQYNEYLEYHDKYEKRVCVDFSISALKQAKKKIGDKGVYVLGDITNMPFLDNSIDTVISLHTVYHVPQQEQLKAFHEIHRITKTGNQSAIIYSWGNRALFMNLFLFPRQLARLCKIGLKRLKNFGPDSHIQENTSRGLYFFSYKRKELFSNLKFDYNLTVWRSVSVPFMRFYIHKLFLGKAILNLIYRLETNKPKLMGKIGQYPVILIKK